MILMFLYILEETIYRYCYIEKTPNNSLFVSKDRDFTGECKEEYK